LKGVARSVEFKSISQEIHEIENILSILRDKDIALSYEIKKELRKKVNDVFAEIDNIRSLQLKFKKFSNINFDEPKKRNEQSLNEFIESLKKMTEDISAELLKKIKFYSENKLTEDPPFLKDLKNPIIHLLRNAIDHGIEDRFERISNGKDETGKVILKLSKQNKEYKIEIFDDGEGINFNRIKKIAVKKGYLKEDADVPNNKLLSLLFTPGFSTSKEVTDLSGRGVGLDVVKDTVNRLKGKISVQTEKNKGTKFIIKIPV
jgi:two-component system chemotaxis sensor kinase CheA